MPLLFLLCFSLKFHNIFKYLILCTTIKIPKRKIFKSSIQYIQTHMHMREDAQVLFAENVKNSKMTINPNAQTCRHIICRCITVYVLQDNLYEENVYLRCAFENISTAHQCCQLHCAHACVLADTLFENALRMPANLLFSLFTKFIVIHFDIKNHTKYLEKICINYENANSIAQKNFLQSDKERWHLKPQNMLLYINK